MPRSDDDPDFLQTYTSEGEGKSKSTRIAPLEVGRNGAPVRVFRHKELSPDALESPPQGVRFLLTDDTGKLVQKNPDGTVTGVGGAPEDAEYVTTTESTALPNDTAHSTLTGADLHDPAQHGSTHEQGGADELDVTGLSGDLADAQDPKVHQSTHQDGGADELQVDTLAGDNGAAGEVLQTDGTALSFGSVGGNVPDFEEDPNSPFTANSDNDITATLSKSFDVVTAFVEAVEVSDDSTFMDVRVNGDSSDNYDFIEHDGSHITGATEWGTVASIFPGSTSHVVVRVLSSGGGISLTPVGSGGENFGLAAGENALADPPVDSLSFLRNGLGSCDWTVEVFGRNI